MHTRWRGAARHLVVWLIKTHHWRGVSTKGRPANDDDLSEIAFKIQDSKSKIQNY